MAVLLDIGTPQLAQQRELELFSSVLPVVVEYLDELLEVRHGHQFLILSINEVNHPLFLLGEAGVLAGFFLQLDEGPAQELGVQNDLTVKFVLIGLALQKHMIDLIELIAVQLGQIQVLSQSEVVGFHFGELLGLGYPLYYLNFGDDDLLLLGYGGGGGLRLLVDVDDELPHAQVLELHLAGDELEGLAPIKLFRPASP